MNATGNINDACRLLEKQRASAWGLAIAILTKSVPSFNFLHPCCCHRPASSFLQTSIQNASSPSTSAAGQRPAPSGTSSSTALPAGTGRRAADSFPELAGLSEEDAKRWRTTIMSVFPFIIYYDFSSMSAWGGKTS